MTPEQRDLDLANRVGWATKGGMRLCGAEDMARAIAVARREGALEAAREMREQCAEVIDQCNREGPYNAIGAAKRIRALPLPGETGKAGK